MKINSTLTGKPGFVDGINIMLMLTSFLLAIKIPFTLFLLSYAILGPLHYLTEIFWLEKNNYYLKNKKDHLWLLVLAVIITALIILQNVPNVQKPLFLDQYTGSMIAVLMFTAFTGAIIFTLFTRLRNKLIAACIILFFSWWMWEKPGYLLFFGLLLSTVIHVCLFTAAFILLGALRNRSLISFLSFAVYIVLIALFIYIPINADAYDFSVNQHNYLNESGFTKLNAAMAKFLGATVYKPYDLLTERSIRIQCFLAFCYTYHYLNWFSKVDIIRWNRVSGRIKMITVITWILAVALYWYDYKTGLLALFLLSLVHVFLEFPLNIRSFIDIGKKLQSKML